MLVIIPLSRALQQSTNYKQHAEALTMHYNVLPTSRTSNASIICFSHLPPLLSTLTVIPYWSYTYIWYQVECLLCYQFIPTATDGDIKVTSVSNNNLYHVSLCVLMLVGYHLHHHIYFHSTHVISSTKTVFCLLQDVATRIAQLSRWTQARESFQCISRLPQYIVHFLADRVHQSASESSVSRKRL